MFASQGVGSGHIILIACLELLKMSYPICDKVKRASVLAYEAIQIFRCEVQIFQARTVAIVININSKIFELLQALFILVQRPGKEGCTVFKVVSKRSYNSPLPECTLQALIH